jgi:hypothetical protein
MRKSSESPGHCCQHGQDAFHPFATKLTSNATHLAKLVAGYANPLIV